ncbi:AraC family transcriptional regulator [Paenibacillus vulneris]|uniref:Helix-turn-helix domain-containing protein n=1 Tax=Paenibacillus vulneris TaxID=1133364 RepID=A0ABW3UWH4_9BACL|nr:helix-turn-helix domain-containing protein [Paenibacillus sp. 32352]
MTNTPLTMTEIQVISRLFHDNFGLSVHYLDDLGDTLWKLGEQTIPFYMNRQDWYRPIQASKQKSIKPILITVTGVEYYAVIHARRGSDMETFVIGPATLLEVTGDTISGLLNDYGLNFKHHGELIDYFERIPIMSRSQMQHACRMLYYLLFRQELRPEEISEYAQPGSEPIRNEDVVKALMDQRDNFVFHPDYNFERQMLRMIKEGQKEELKKLLNSFPNQPGKLAKKSQLRNGKNYAICAITLATRAAIDGGLNDEIARTMSDIYIQQIEEVTSYSDVKIKQNEFMLEFAHRVAKLREQTFSKTVLTCKNYIFNHLYEDITVTKLSELTHLHPNYLSQVFKKEVGCSLKEYIQQVKVEEAKSLLKLNELSLSEICFRLNFNDQSYFTKVFKKFTGKTPKQFQNE